MTTGIVHITDKNFRITIPEEIREVENLKPGDYIQIEVTKLDLKKSVVDVLAELNKKLDELPDKIADAIKSE